ncbi:MAG TPA: GNAT family N-acetyltransferase, partial [Stellaceae bacterium]|nr:GNAT family N-acetyltransferase [Stellaceae bacterium]
MSDSYAVRRLTSVSDRDAQGLALVLIDCVDGGASVGFMHPLSMETALAFWRRVGREVEKGARALLIAEDAAGIVGTVQIVLEQPENQP